MLFRSLMDPEMENLPTDYTAGLDFNIKKTSKGGYADYNTSTWARKETALNADEQAAIEEHGLYNLADFLPKEPSEVELKVIKEMFEASVDGKPYDTERWGQYYRPAGVQAPGGNAGSTDHADEDAPKAAAPAPKLAAVPKAEPTPWEDDEPAAASAPVQTAAKPTQKAEDILAMIRSRQQK